MMAYHQRVNQFKSRIDFDDPSTTKPPSLAKSAVLQALEEEERQQQSRGKGGGGAGFLLQQSRPSRSRQREPVAAAERARTPCINRDTVLRINRRPVRHRSCDSFWPPAKTAARSPSPRGQLGGAEADDDNADAGVGRGRTQANEDSCKTSPEKDSADGLGKSLPSKPRTPLGSFSANSADVDGEKCDQNANEARKLRHRDVSEDNYSNREDVFTNVAIFSWNPLDVYQQHGLFMIDPRFALADLHATTGGCNASTDDDAHSSSTAVHGRRPEDDTDATTASSSIGMPALTDGADPSSDADVNSFATQRGDVLLLESHKIPNVGSPARSPATVDHFYDSAHVEYPVRPDLSLSSSSATTKECHQSPPSPPPPPLVESDYDNDLAKCNPQDGEDRQEGTPGRVVVLIVVVEWCVREVTTTILFTVCEGAGEGLKKKLYRSAYVTKLRLICVPKPVKTVRIFGMEINVIVTNLFATHLEHISERHAANVAGTST